MNGIRWMLVCAAVFSCVYPGIAQGASNIATLTIRVPQESYPLGADIVLESTIKNISKGNICFEESPQGYFDAELYDLQDKSGTDLALPLMQKKHKPVHIRTMGFYFPPISSGGSVNESVRFGEPSTLLSHPGSYKVIISRQGQVNNVNVVADPVIIEIASK